MEKGVEGEAKGCERGGGREGGEGVVGGEKGKKGREGRGKGEPGREGGRVLEGG